VAKRDQNGGGKQLSRGPFDFRAINRELRRVGYESARPGDHVNLEHPGRRGKVQLSTQWRHVKVGGWIWRNLCRQSGYSKEELQRILNGLDP
jgi:hypothetical protein